MNRLASILICFAGAALTFSVAAAQSMTVSAQTASTQSDSAAAPSAADFNSARRLLHQGKFEDALAALHEIQAKQPTAKGLAHEFGVAYYKKADYPNAITYLKKAHDE